MQRFLELPRQLRGAQLRAESFDGAANTVVVIWTTGAKVRRYSWRDSTYYDEELVVEPGTVRLDRLNAGAPFLNTHSDWSLEDVIGSVVPGSARVEKGNGYATIKLSGAPGDADNVAKIKDGIIRNVSVGYIIHRVEKMEADDGMVPVWRVTDWEPMEVSAVPVPADPGATIRSAARKEDTERLYRAVLVEPRPSVVRSRSLATQDAPGWVAPLK
ncbi:HK97 family phage prohead protease [Methylocystis rosea]|uniref:Prohead serine protease domain-containing protein n=1 Tax=Methylocystis rosea TaxID=173366 RepID=A0A3G8M216_9HYPH|nr:HK97 family phage prohead protease [Methylocystis rosea]AZG75986.1 hypothetical protein EHO51_04140 [Methylocystis rosea]